MDPSQIPPLPPSHQAPAGQKALRVHVIEGDASFARDVARALEARGMIARAIVGGQAGIDEVQLDPPDLIVLCADLPDVSGYTVCSRLKRARESGAIPIILTSARPDTSAFQSHQKLWVRADAYLRKPFDVAALAALLQKLAPLVAERRAAAAAQAAPTPDDGDVLEDGFEFLGDGEAPTAASDGAALEAPPPMPAAVAGDEVFDDGLVRVVVEAPVPAMALGGAVLEDKDVRIELPVGAPAAAASVAARSAPPPVPRAAARAPVAGASAPGRGSVVENGATGFGGGEELDRHGVARASRTAPGRWKLPAGFGAVA